MVSLATTPVVVQVDGAVLAQDLEHEAQPEQQAGQGDDERRYADLGEEEAVQRADGRAGDDGDEDREPLVHAVGDAEHGDTIAPATPLTEPTDRSISPSSSTKTMPTAIMPVADHGDRDVARGCRAERKLVVQALEDDRR